MKNLKNYIAIVALTGVLGVGNAFGTGVIPPAGPRPMPRAVSSSFVDGSWFDALVDYVQSYFSDDDGGNTNETGVIPPTATRPVNQGVIPPSRK